MFPELIYRYLRNQASYILVCTMTSLDFCPNPDGICYHTLQLTDILGYSSKLIWLSYTNILNRLCFRLVFVVTLLANVWTHDACNRKEEYIYDSKCDI